MPEKYSKSTKIAITACTFSKISGKASRRIPHSFFTFQSASNLFCEKKYAGKNVEIMPLPLFKNFLLRHRGQEM